MVSGFSRLPDDVALEEAWNARLALVFKHSSACGRSWTAHGEIERFAGRHPEVPIRIIEVRTERPLSDQVAEKSGIRHQSPQALLLRDGRVSWHGSHEQVTCEAIEARLPNGDD